MSKIRALSTKELDFLVATNNAKVRIALSGLYLSGLVQEKLARDPNPVVRAAFAANVFLTEKVQGILLQDDDEGAKP